MALNVRQQKFVEEYAKTGNATEAAALAGYSERTAKQIGSRLLTNVDVQREVAALRTEARTGAVMGLREAQEILSRMARGRLADFLDETGAIDVEKLRAAGGELNAYEEVAVGDAILKRKIKLQDPRAAIETLGKLSDWQPKDEGQVVNNFYLGVGGWMKGTDDGGDNTGTE